MKSILLVAASILFFGQTVLAEIVPGAVGSPASFPSGITGTVVAAGYASAPIENQTTSDFIKLQMNIKEFDDANIFDAGTNFRLNPTVSGKYAVTFCAGVISSVSLALRSFTLSIFKNESRFKELYVTDSAGPASVSRMNACVHAIIAMNGSTDYVDFRVRGFVTSGDFDVLGGQSAAFWSAHRIME